MKIRLNGNLQIIMSNNDSYHNYFAWPTVTRLQNGKIAVVASGFRLSHVCPFGKTVISYSEDEGNTYTSPAPVFDTPLDDRDGGILAYGDKNVIVTSLNRAPKFLKYRMSIGSGIPKENPMIPYRNAYLDSISEDEVNKYHGSQFRFSSDCGVTFGPIYKSPISSPHGPTALKDGSLIWIGRDFLKEENNELEDVYLRVYKIFSDGSMECIGHIENIKDAGDEIRISCEPHAIQLDSGRIICHIRAEKTNDTHITLYQAYSDDNGKTWSKPVKILEENGGAPSHILKHSSGALISTYGCRANPFGVKAMISTNDGESWEELGYLYTDEHLSDLGYPSTVELKDKSLATVFYAHPEKDGPAVIMQQKWVLE